MTNQFTTIQYECKDSVGTITLNRPEVFNACNEAMTSELLAALKQVEKDASVRAVILTGAGKAFCSGQDLKDLEEQYKVGWVMDPPSEKKKSESTEPTGGSNDPPYRKESRPLLGERLRKGYNPVIQKMCSLEKPIIAAVNGVAAGAGCSLALAADLRIMASSATLIEVFVNVGLIPDSGSTFFLPRLVGYAKAMELCATGDKVTADQALQLGLAHKVVPVESLLEEAQKLASRLAALPTKAIGLAKRLLWQSYQNNLDQQLELEAFAQETAGKTADHLEGVRAFIEKRKPDFQGR